MLKQLFFLGLLLSQLTVFGQQWKIDSYEISFKIKNAGITVDGKFKDFTGSIFFDPANPSTAKMQGKVAVKSIDTGINLRNEHLQGEEYFNATAFPSISMTLNKLTEKNGAYVGIFTLEIKGVKKSVELPLTFTPQNNTAALSGKFKIDRLDFGVGESSFMLSDDVLISIHLKISHP